ncbi:MAG: hypothetical protein WBZ36_25270, partial [Candidatus Nitrosopolaris sp.]
MINNCTQIFNHKCAFASTPVPHNNDNERKKKKKPTPNKNEKFYDLPTPIGPPPYHLDLSRIIPVDKIVKSGEISFHILGDTGSTKILDPTHMVENAM